MLRKQPEAQDMQGRPHLLVIYCVSVHNTHARGRRRPRKETRIAETSHSSRLTPFPYREQQNGRLCLCRMDASASCVCPPPPITHTGRYTVAKRTVHQHKERRLALRRALVNTAQEEGNGCTRVCPYCFYRGYTGSSPQSPGWCTPTAAASTPPSRSAPVCQAERDATATARAWPDKRLYDSYVMVRNNSCGPRNPSG